MLSVKKNFRRLIHRVQGRFQRARSGSVLILVVVLLVLMALLGTAFLVTSSNDRYASKLYEHNVEIDMLVDGVKNMAISAITSDTSYQHSNAQYYDDWFSTRSPANLNAVDHSWLASRVPTQVSYALGLLPSGGYPRYPVPRGAIVQIGAFSFPAAGATFTISTADNNMFAPSEGNWINVTSTKSVPSALPNTDFFTVSSPVWPAISAPLIPGANFEDPHDLTVDPTNARFFVAPSFLTVNGQNLPAFVYFNMNPTNPSYTKEQIALAASASGDGIADSFLYRLPVGTIDGVTYYTAVRIIDHNSAINVNTANSSSVEFGFNGAQDASQIVSGFGPGIFPGDIGLAEILASTSAVPGGFDYSNIAGKSASNFSAELSALNDYRFNYAQTGQHWPSGIQNDPKPPVDSGVPRSDMSYRHLADAMWMGLGRRIDSPGLATSNGAYQPFTWDDALALSYRYDLLNPNTTPSPVEEMLVWSLYSRHGIPGTTNPPPAPDGSHPTSPWDPASTNGWWNTFPVVNPTFGANIRPYLTARNPTNNGMPAHKLLDPTSATLNPVTQLFDAELTAVMPYLTGDYDPNPKVKQTAYDPQALVPKVSLNTADITAQDFPGNARTPTLWLGFYNAMLDAFQPQTVYNHPLPTGTPPTPTTIKVPSAALYNFTTNTFYATAGNQAAGAAQFRSPIRDVTGMPSSTTYMTAGQTMLLRSLLAAVNAADLRDSDDFPTEVTVTGLRAVIKGTPTIVKVKAYGLEKQPFITEVYANNCNGTPMDSGYTTSSQPNQNGYVAVQLYNPYDTPITMTSWQLQVLTRDPTATGYPLKKLPTLIATINGVIPPKSYLVLENYGGTSPGDAKFRPWVAGTSTIDPTKWNTAGSPVTTLDVPNLYQAMAPPGMPTGSANGPGTELYLTRQSYKPDGTPGGQAPVDSFDFTGIGQTLAGATAFTAIHYLRMNPAQHATTVTNPLPYTDANRHSLMWRFVYGGRWSPNDVNIFTSIDKNKKPNPDITGMISFNQEGVAVSTWDTSPTGTVTPKKDTWNTPTTAPGGTANLPGVLPPPTGNVAYKAPFSFGLEAMAPSYASGLTSSTTFNIGPIQIANTDMGGPNKISASTGNQFPFGGFARVGDVLQVPFIGSYVIMTTDESSIIEMNPVTHDCTFADDNDTGGLDDVVEQVGRFCPLLAAEQTILVPAMPTITDPSHLDTNQGQIPLPQAPYTLLPTVTGPYDYYGWASNVLSYFTVLTNPSNAYSPNIVPYRTSTGANVTGTGPVPAPAPAVPTVDGLININTADVRTIQAIPFIPTYHNTASATDAIFPLGNTTTPFTPTYYTPIAQAIVQYRNTYGPFKTLFDLNRVSYGGVTIQSLYGDPTKYDFDQRTGDLSGPYAASGNSGDGVTNDFETRFSTITRVSNLLTTRSDTFTVYVLVQGWTGVGTPQAQMVVQRRVAFIIDRSANTTKTPAFSTHTGQITN